MKSSLAPLAALLAATTPVEAVVENLTSQGAPMRWASPSISVQMRGDEVIDFSLVHEGVRNAAATWSAVANSNLEITVSSGSIPGEPVIDNSVNEWGWSDEWEHQFLSPSTVCLTTSRVFADTGVIAEADTMCNAAHHTWNYSLVNGGYQPGNLHVDTSAMHEFGHWVGLDHTVVYGDLMYPLRSEHVHESLLDAQEFAFIRYAYADGTSPNGAIHGQVRKTNNTTVPYAYVQAINVATGNRYGAATNALGYYTVMDVPAGTYFLRIHPLTTDTILASVPYRSNSPANLDFHAQAYPYGNVTVAGGATTSNVHFFVSLSGSAPDSNEPNNTAANAKPLTVGFTTHSHTEQPGDVDWFYFQSQPGQCYVVKTSFTGANIVSVDDEFFWSETSIALYDHATGALKEASYSRNIRAADPRSWLTYCETGAGRRLDLKVEQRESQAGGSGYYYQVSVSPVLYPASPNPVIDELSPRVAFEFDTPYVVIRGDNFLPDSTVRVRCDGGPWQNASWVAVGSCNGNMMCGKIEAHFPSCDDGGADVEVATPDNKTDIQYGGPPYGFEYLVRPFGSFADNTWSAFGYLPGGSNGICIGDLNDDGLQDLVRPVNDTNSDIVFRNNGDTTFSNVSASWGVAPPSELRYESCALTDIDNDGDLDAYFVQSDYFCDDPGSNRLFINHNADTGGTSTYLQPEVGEYGIDSGVDSLKTDAAFADFDNDGDLDIVMTSNPYCGSPPYDQQSVRLYRQKSDGTFEQTTTQAGLGSQVRHFLSVHVADFDDNLCPDFFLNAYAGDSSQLFTNDCDGTFTNRTVQSLIVTEWCKAIEIADFDNDGDNDIFCGTPSAGPGGLDMQLWRNNGSAVFTNVASSAGLTPIERNVTAATAFDFNNDGCEDLYLGNSKLGWPDDNHDMVLRNNCGSSISFTDVTNAVGVDPGEPYHRDVMGVASFDMLGDGGWSIYASGWTQSLPQPWYDGDYLWRNTINLSGDDDSPYQIANHFVDVELDGANEPGDSDLSNRRGIGAKVTVIPDYPGVETATDAQCLAKPLPTGTVSYTKEMRGGSRSQDPMILHFGLGSLGNRSDIDCIAVRWPSGLKVAYHNLSASSYVLLREEPGQLRIIKAIPNNGPNTQSTEVRLIGFKFQNGATVTFGGMNAPSVQYIADTELRAWTPLWQSPGNVNITVTNPDGEYAVLEAGFSYTGSNTFIVVKDPYPALTANYQVPNDPTLVSACCNDEMRTGVQADGATELIFEVEVAGPGSVHFLLDDDNNPSNQQPPTSQAGTVEPLNHSSATGGIVVPVTQLPDGRYMGHAVYRAPLNFIRNSADESLDRRPLVIRATYIPTGGGSFTMPDRTIDLRRVGVIYVHGMWGDTKTFGWPVMKDPRWFNHVADYKETNARAFAENRDMPPRVILETRTALNDMGIAATRFFVFGHSMGGVLFKIYMAGQGAAYSRNDNFLAGDVYALIPVDSPMQGSYLAPSTRSLVGIPKIGPVIAHRGEAAGFDMDDGCMWSLDPENQDTLGIGSAVGRFAVGVGWGGGEMRDLGVQLADGSELAKLEMLLRFGNRAFEDYLLQCNNGDDFIVCVPSQEGGVPQQFTTDFHYQGPSERGIHFGSVCWEPDPSDWAKNLLNTPVTNNGVWATQLPSTASMPPLAPPRAPSSEGNHAALQARFNQEHQPQTPEGTSSDGYTLSLGKQGGEIVLNWSGSPTRLLKSFGDATLASALCLAVSGGSFIDVGEMNADSGNVFYGVTDSSCIPVGGSDPTITSISPSTGSTVGGYEVTIQGVNFDPGGTLEVDGIPVSSAVIEPNGQIATYTAPSHNVGVVLAEIRNPDASSDSTTFAYQVPGDPPGGITIVSPAPGISVAGGTPLTIRAVASGAFTIAKAMASSEAFIEDTDLDPGPAFQATVTIPSDYLGALNVNVDAQDNQGNVVSAIPVTVNVTQPPGVEMLRIHGAKLTLLSMQPQRKLKIEGVFSDGINRDMSNVPGMVYEIDPPNLPQFPYSGTAIATVDANGVVTAKTRGTTICHVTYGQYVTDVLINVDEIALTLRMRLQEGIPQIVWLYMTPQGVGVTYDIVRGSLSTLRVTGGNFTPASTKCVKNNFPNVTATEVDYSSGIPAPGDGFFYLVRDSRVMNYDTLPHWPSSTQVGSRNAEINASGTACAP